MLKRLAKVLFGCAVVAVSACSNAMPERSAQEWMADGRGHSAQERWEDAVADLTEVLRLEPKSHEALVLRAHASLKNGDADQALEDSKAALDLQPNDLEMLRLQAHVYRGRGDFERVQELSRKAKGLMGPSPAEFHERGNGAENQGDYAMARTHFENALRANPHNPLYLNDLAWLEAACPEPELRDGSRAVELAMEACQRTQWRGAAYVDTLAAAYAETGKFDKAVEMQQKATDLARPGEREDYRRRLKVYQEGKPYRFSKGR